MSDRVKEDACKKAASYKFFLDFGKWIDILHFRQYSTQKKEFEASIFKEYDKICKGEQKIKFKVYDIFERNVKFATHYQLYEERPTIEKAKTEDNINEFERLREWNRRFPPNF